MPAQRDNEPGANERPVLGKLIRSVRLPGVTKQKKFLRSRKVIQGRFLK